MTTKKSGRQILIDVKIHPKRGSKSKNGVEVTKYVASCLAGISLLSDNAVSFTLHVALNVSYPPVQN